ncbi:MFS family permease [Luteibacter sp. 1214]|uniref:MFS transporter n=1 Tax=Luteibacter sp. 1214 TaxID=2817735 RepID=UPI0028581E88|nr:MFS transporter [Luteibacter sp. 1214]MDR6643543.1 MFS family permease [Luteibacter sp. 1214]
MRGRRPLEALNFFVADVQAGIGPFLGVFLQSAGWRTGAIGTVMTIGGVAGLLVTAPAGAVVDATRYKRLAIVVSSICTVIASCIVWYAHSFPMVVLSQVATAIAGALLGPAIAGVTLGMARARGFDRQFGRNQVANHAGNVVGAGVSGFIGWRFGFGGVFLVAGVFGVLAVVSTLLIPADAIDHRAARGLESDDGDNDDAPSGVSILVTCRPLLILAAALALFHLGNAAMLPLYGMAVVAAHQAEPSSFTALTIVVAQLVMVGTSLLAMRLIRTRGYWQVILVTFLALPLRGALAAFFINRWGVFPVQVLDGIGAGLQSVAVPALVARLMQGTGRVNVAQGAVMTMQGVGAALSPALGGWLAETIGFHGAFLCLGAVSMGSLGLWWGGRARLHEVRTGG